MLNKIHHIAIICGDYERSKSFYTEVLGLQIINETYRAARNSYKLDLALHGAYVIELFSFPTRRPGLRGRKHAGFGILLLKWINLKR